MKHYIPLFEEFEHGINYTTEYDDEDQVVSVTASISGEKIGEASAYIMYDQYVRQDLSDVIDEDECDRLFPDDLTGSISHVKVDKNYLRQGIAKHMMQDLMIELRKRNLRYFYLNASTMDTYGATLEQLVEFYKQFGFRELVDQGNNMIMGITA